ncbi:MAG: hypothetical protein L3J37_06430 [Rhodobacteraceae bacterium]|nr:hypothetical protein [Paracoccaceae bacterium]
MRSYEAARSLFSFLAFMAWSVIVIGVLVAIVSAAGVSQYAGGGAGLLAMIPGIGIGLAGFILVAFVQMGRANVDTAEYTQQMLKVSRDQLDVSKQSLKQGDAFQKSYSALNKETKDTAQNPGYAAKTAKPENAAPSRETPVSNYGKKTSYNGHAISEANGIFHVENAEFRQIDHAKEHIDMLFKKDELMAKIAELSAVTIPKHEPISAQPDPAPEPMQLKTSQPIENAPEPDTNLVEYNGKVIEPSGEKFMCNGIPFNTLSAAKNYVDNFASVPPKTLPGVKRT